MVKEHRLWGVSQMVPVFMAMEPVMPITLLGQRIFYSVVTRLSLIDKSLLQQQRVPYLARVL
jgi:hypothetical protein